MAVGGWVLDKSAAVRAAQPGLADALTELAGALFVCPVGELEQLYSARSTSACSTSMGTSTGSPRCAR